MSDREERRVALAILAIGVVIMIVRATSVARSMDVLDDAYMYVRYARHFLGGLGHAWNPDGAQTYGSTSLVHFVLVTMIEVLVGARVSHETVVRAASIVPGSMAIVVVSATLLRPGPRYAALIGAVAVAWFIDTRLWAIHFVSGMDTMTSILALSLLVHTATRGNVRAWKVALVAYGAFLARPDNGVIVVLFAPLYVYFVAQRVDARRWCARFGAVLIGCFAGGGVLTYAIFRDALPLPFYAKQSGYLLTYAGAAQWNPFVYLGDLSHALWPFVVVVLLAASWRIALAFLLPAAITIGYFFSVVQLMGSDARFYFPSTVLLVAAAVWSVHRVLSGGREWRASLAVRVAACVTVPVLPRVISHAAVRWQARAPHIATVDPLHNEYFVVSAARPLPTIANIKLAGSVGARFAESLPQGTVSAMSEHGYIGAESPRLTIVDLVGLHDRAIAHRGFRVDDLVARGVDVVWGPHPDYTGIVRAMLASPDFRREYDYYAGAFNFGVAIRRSSPRYTTIDSLFAAEWARTYPGFSRDDYRARFPDSAQSGAHARDERARH